MSYQVLARKWRPRDFATLVGQEHVVRALTHALKSGRLHHAWLFTGTRGVGKTTLARILAKSLNCVGPDGQGGVTDAPCGVCEACTAIDAGRFVDYIEMDAASNRGVDEMVTLLERAMYAPSNARFKVYMIDEVHQLSNHAFNAMLKTLEEPPEYVKFILATTDPQKVPVTVLSRCLQFNLKNMTPAAIAGHMEFILEQEGVEAEPAALRMLAHAARGSMRDGLSLLDQAIAYAAGPVSLDAVRAMLGAIDSDTLVRIVEAVHAGEARAALAVADEMGTRSLSYGQGLRDLASLLHRVALAQQVPGSVAEDEADAAEIARLAALLGPEETQLYYQIALHGRNDLHLAPDEYAGFSMSLLRMLAFAPAGTASPRAAALVSARPSSTSVAAPRAAPRSAARPRATDDSVPATREPAQAAVDRPQRAVTKESAEVPVLKPAADSAPAAATARAAVPPAPVPAARVLDEVPAAAAVSEPVAAPLQSAAQWPAFVAALPLNALARELARRSELIGRDGNTLRLRVDAKHLAEPGTVKRLEAALAEALGGPCRVEAEVGAPAGPTAASLDEAARAQRQREAQEAIVADPFVRELIEQFGAEVDPASVRPRSQD
jgi:DNA polymerase-3 subunit gamma/tau